MAVATQTRQYSKKIVFNLFAVAVLGWLILLGWALELWLQFGFDSAYIRLHQLLKQQQAAITQFNDASIAKRLNSIWEKLPTEYLSDRASDLNDSIRNVIPNTQFINTTELTRITNSALRMTQQLWQCITATGRVMLVKCIILVAAIPLFLLAIVVGLVDGLNQRAIRTASLGRESSYVFHQMNRLFKRGLIVLLGLWLSIPVSITPALMLIPVSLLLSVMVSITTSRFKKYL